MESLKIRVNSEVESKEAQELFSKLGYMVVNNIDCEKGYIVASKNAESPINFDYWYDVKNIITFQQLKDMVVLKRNSIDDATHYYGGSRYYLTDSEFYQYSEDKWVNIDEYVDGMTFKKMGKEVKKKEFLNPEQEYALVEYFVGETPIPNGWIEVPEGAEILYFDKRYEASNHFFKTVDGESYYKYLENDSEWMNYHGAGLDEFKENIDNFSIMWQRNTATPNTSIQDKLKFIEKWLNGEKIQYILGVESDKIQSEKTQWHNFTEGAMQYIKRSDIKFREAPKYVTINGVEFKSVNSLLKHVKNNFDLDDGE